jgi:hypothetical protein
MYDVVDDGGPVSNAKARRLLAWDPIVGIDARRAVAVEGRWSVDVRVRRTSSEELM